MIERTSSSVGGVVDVERIESLPLNGRQFANAAITIPGVGLGFHSDPTKSTQYSPQIAGGNGRNVNYQIDGGDNNDDTVGGLLQLFPLEAIQEFNFVTQRYKAEYGRSNGGVMNIVTKSGTNQMRGSWFTNLRDKDLNARDDDREDQQRRQAALPPLPVRRLVRRADRPEPRALLRRLRAHAAGHAAGGHDARACSRTRDGVFPTPSRENLFTGKVSSEPHAVAVRCRCATAATPTRRSTTPRRAPVPENWGDSDNTFNSINLNHNWVLGGSKLNEFVFQYADFENHIAVAHRPRRSRRSRTA